jgi:hypothetical protein
MSDTLDRKRPFGKIHGDEVLGRCFEQDGQFFNSQGKLWIAPPPGADEPVYTAAAMEAAVADATAKAKADVEKNIDARIAAALAAAGVGGKGK